MPRQQIIEVNYEMPFKGMLVQAGVPKHQRAKIFAQLESEELFFEFKTRRSFEIEDVNFNEPILSRKVSRLIRAASIGETEWKPFDIEHLLAYFMKSPAKFKSGFVFASKRVYGVEGVPHIFMMGTDKGHADLELVKDDHPWAAVTSNFPKYHRLPKAV
ncbi:hypothetical protein H7Y21_02410 [Arenimonas sp.]|nr:hypothetical protein [Candidatus Parcubacteria bacterium]